MPTYEALPPELPVPLDDGATDHLSGMSLPDRPLTGTTEQAVNPSTLGGRSILYVYPMTGRPGVALPDGWDAIPGARGCTPETCGFRDHLGELREAGVDQVLGVSSQSLVEQREGRARLHLPFELLSDADFAWAARARVADLQHGRAPLSCSPHPDGARRRDRTRFLPGVSTGRSCRAGRHLATVQQLSD